MRHKLASFVMASLLMLVASNSYAYYGFPNSGQWGRNVYVSAVDTCDSNVVMVQVWYNPQRIAGSFTDDKPPLWFYIDSNEIGMGQFRRLVATAAAAQATHFQVTWYLGDGVEKTINCGGVNITAEQGELTHLELSNQL